MTHVRPSGRRGVCAPSLVAIALVAGCAGEPTTDAARAADPTAPSRWTLSAEPVLELGVIAGDAAEQFADITGVVRLTDGRVVVLNANSQELRFFSPDGTHLQSVGGLGEGPGEFRSPSRLWRGAGDTLRVYDESGDRFSVFAPDGGFLRTEPGPWSETATPDPLAPADPFRLDEWVYGWNWIDSPLAPHDRGGVVRALAKMPPPDPSGPVREVLVSPRGLLWTMTPSATTPIQWRVYRPDGTPLATVETPVGFELYEVGSDYVLGVYRDELGVEYVQSYELNRAGDADFGPGLEALSGAGPAVYPELLDETYEAIVQALRRLASLQEIYYSDHYSYSAVLDSLSGGEALASRAGGPPRISQLIPADGLLQIKRADERGWTGVFIHTPSGASCVTAHGYPTPPGWRGGAINCPGS